MIAGILLGSSAVLAVGLFFAGNFKDNQSKRFNIVSKVLSLVFAVVYLLRLFLFDKIFDFAGYGHSVFSPGTYYYIVILRALTMCMVLATTIAPWFGKKHLFNLVAFGNVIVYALNIFAYKTNIIAFVGNVAIPSYSFREIQFAVECVLGLAIGTMYLTRKIINKDWEQIGKQLWQMGLALLLITLAVMPYSTLYNLFGEFGGVAEGFSATHLFMLAVTVGVTLGGYLILRKFSQSDRYYVLTTLAITVFIQYWYFFEWPFTIGTLPLHLCNAAATLMMIAFIFKIKPLFSFNYLINILGAVFAVTMPDFTEAISLPMGVHFWYQHIMLIAIPILGVALGVFPRPNIKSVLGCLGVFVVYYLVTCTVEAMFIDEVNYFFLNTDKLVKIAKKVFPESLFGEFGAFFANIRNDVVIFNIGNTTFTVYRTYWIGLFVAYSIFVLIQWVLFYGLYNVADDHYRLHNIKIQKRLDTMKLKTILQNRKPTEPMYPDERDVIRIDHFSKVYSGSTEKAVDDFSLTIHGGEVYGFLGHNGAGKSTTIKSLVGIQTITDGSIRVCGYDVEKQSVEAKLNIGYVSDNHAVYEKLTGREYINYVANLYLVPEEQRKERFEKYVTMFNLHNSIDREIKGYSHGMKQKIVVIASLMHDPKIWVLDEPLTGLDPTSSFQIKECMRDHANRGNIVFFSSHVIEVVEKICDKICIIGHGKLVGEWKLSELAQSGTTLEQLYMKYVSKQNLVTDVDGKKAEDEIKEKGNTEKE